MITPQAAYAKLFRVLCQFKKLHYAEWSDFMKVTEVIHLKANERITETGTPSTHSYFIISGLVMCYEGDESKGDIKWFRAENDYAFTIDMLNVPGKRPNNQCLVALEDMVVVRLSHKDFKWLCDKYIHMHALFAGYLHKYGKIMEYMFGDFTTEPRERYEWIQKLFGFKLSRIPEDYLVRYTGLTVKQLKVLRKDRKVDFLSRY
jgi:cAMP-binding proteins - catabolite gene activator and regulatory subunit of cAMP-dependent protein kinases